MELGNIAMVQLVPHCSRLVQASSGLWASQGHYLASAATVVSTLSSVVAAQGLSQAARWAGLVRAASGPAFSGLHTCLAGMAVVASVGYAASEVYLVAASAPLGQCSASMEAASPCPWVEEV
jgi:hypothetical protein